MSVMADGPTTAVDDVRIVDNPAEQRYEAHLNGRVAGISEYTLEPGASQITFVHTEVDPAYEGKGVGSRLAAGALADVRARGLTVVAECPFIGAYLRRHARDYEDIVAR
jgi:hypothetical protein